MGNLFSRNRLSMQQFARFPIGERLPTIKQPIYSVFSDFLLTNSATMWYFFLVENIIFLQAKRPFCKGKA